MSVESALTAALVARLGHLDVSSCTETPWHSATFSGMRHAFAVATEVAVDIQQFSNEIAEADIRIPGGFVADVEVRACPGDARRLNIEVLTIAA